MKLKNEGGQMISIPPNTAKRNKIAAQELVASGETVGRMMNARGNCLYTMSVQEDLLVGIHFHVNVDGTRVYFGALKR